MLQEKLLQTDVAEAVDAAFGKFLGSCGQRRDIVADRLQWLECAADQIGAFDAQRRGDLLGGIAAALVDARGLAFDGRVLIWRVRASHF